MLITASLSSIAQINEKSFTFNMEGQAGLATNSNAVLFSIGGASLKFNFSKAAFALNFGPALKYEKMPGKILITPVFAVAPQLYFLKNKRFILSMPFYYSAALNEWVITGGVGYVFTKPKTLK